MSSRWLLLGLVGIILAGCGGEDDGLQPDFADDYLSTYVEVRNCRQSGDHDLNNIRILADPTAVSSYQDRTQTFSEGNVILKEEFAFDDRDCTGPIQQWTVMRRLADGADPQALDWAWQKVDATRRVVEENTPLCYGCHTGCGVPPDGFDGTCAVP